MGSKRKKMERYFCSVKNQKKEAFPSVKWEDNEPTRVIIRLA